MTSHRIVQRVARQFRDFVCDQRGNITLMATLSAIPVVAAVGAGVDYARISRETTALSAAVDSALLATISSENSKLSGLTEAQKAQRLATLKTTVTNYLKDNYNSERGASAEINATLVINGDTVTMTATQEMPMTLMSFLGTPSINITVTSEAVRGLAVTTPIEMALVMDTTGSMGSTYMNQAKVAARQLLTTIYDGDKATKKENPNIRLSLVPFAAAVRLNKSASDFNMDWIDTNGSSSVSRINFSDSSWHNYMAWSKMKVGSSSLSWNGCVEARPRGSAPFDYNVNDEPPTAGVGDSLFTPYFAPDEPTFSGSTSSRYSFDNSYIGTSGSPMETTGISNSTNSSNHANRQKNINKYNNRTITAEASSSYGPWYNCARTSVVPMTYDRAKIEDGITAMSAGGNTLIAEGLAWGWRTLSPGEPFTKVEAGPTIGGDEISSYDSKWKKVLVLMTDGENNVSGGLNSLNGSSYSAYGFPTTTLAKNRFGSTTPSQAESKLDDAMMELCTNIKATGVEIYTVAFRVNTTTILNNLKNCASSPAHYSKAADGTELAAVFTAIGENVKANLVYLSK